MYSMIFCPSFERHDDESLPTPGVDKISCIPGPRALFAVGDFWFGSTASALTFRLVLFSLSCFQMPACLVLFVCAVKRLVSSRSTGKPVLFGGSTWSVHLFASLAFNQIGIGRGRCRLAVIRGSRSSLRRSRYVRHFIGRYCYDQSERVEEAFAFGGVLLYSAFLFFSLACSGSGWVRALSTGPATDGFFHPSRLSRPNYVGHGQGWSSSASNSTRTEKKETIEGDGVGVVSASLDFRKIERSIGCMSLGWTGQEDYWPWLMALILISFF